MAVFHIRTLDSRKHEVCTLVKSRRPNLIDRLLDTIEYTLSFWSIQIFELALPVMHQSFQSDVSVQRCYLDMVLAMESRCRGDV